MKAIIEVEHGIGDVYKILSKRYGSMSILLAGDEIEIIQENTMSGIKHTQEEWEEIFNNIWITDRDINRAATIKQFQKNNWIVKDEIEQAIDALKDFYNRYYLSAGINEFHGIKDYVDTAIELLQNKIKELEK
jgi:hypothetical protein